MKNTLISVLTVMGLFYVTNVRAQNVETPDQNVVESGLDLNDQNADASLSDIWGTIKDTAKDAYKGIKGVVSSATDLAKMGFKTAAALATKLGVADQLSKIPGSVLQLGSTAIENWIKNAAQGVIAAE